jgi:hypothetical protein
MSSFPNSRSAADSWCGNCMQTAARRFASILLSCRMIFLTLRGLPASHTIYRSLVGCGGLYRIRSSSSCGNSTDIASTEQSKRTPHYQHLRPLPDWTEHRCDPDFPVPISRSKVRCALFAVAFAAMPHIKTRLSGSGTSDGECRAVSDVGMTFVFRRACEHLTAPAALTIALRLAVAPWDVPYTPRRFRRLCASDDGCGGKASRIDVRIDRIC